MTNPKVLTASNFKGKVDSWKTKMVTLVQNSFDPQPNEAYQEWLQVSSSDMQQRLVDLYGSKWQNSDFLRYPHTVLKERVMEMMTALLASKPTEVKTDAGV